MKTILAFSLVLLLGACGFTPQGDFVRQQVSEKGAQAYDEGLANAHWFVCNAASVGSVRRAYGKSETDARLYREFCATGEADPEADVIRPPE